MALKPTIYKFKIALSDLNNDYYTTVSLTVAQHPSETVERMMARVLAFCLHASQDTENLMVFTKGLSSVEQPDIWIRGLDDQLHLWLDVGEPSYERMKKACRLAKQTCVYSFNSKSDVWWKQAQAQLATLPLQVCQFEWEDIQTLSRDTTRTMDFSITITGETAYLALANSQVEINWRTLQAENR